MGGGQPMNTVTSHNPGPACSAAVSPAEQAMHDRLEQMPREIGVLLVSIGALGMVLPGMVGTPALLAGGLMLWPRGFRSVNGWLRRRFPRVHGHGVDQLLRYLDDMENRYPLPSSHREKPESRAANGSP